jgi:hypothetical protein
MQIRLYPASWCILPCYKNKEFSFLKESFAFLFTPTLGRFVVFGNSDDRKKALLETWRLNFKKLNLFVFCSRY